MNDLPEFFEPTSLTATRKMQKRVNHCLDLIINEDVDEVLTAFEITFSTFTESRYSKDEYYSGVLKKGVLDCFLDYMEQTLESKKYSRRAISQTPGPHMRQKGGMLFRFFHPSETISHQISNQINQGFLKTSERDEALSFLGELISAYALAVPEPLFRASGRFKGLHRTYETPAIDDNLPMTDEMIIFAWKYFWFYSWLGY